MAYQERVLGSFARLSSTRANGLLGLCSDAAVCVLLLQSGVRAHTHGLISISFAFATGLLVFSLVEYSIHRWLFHGSILPFNDSHRRHHDEPLGYEALPFFLPPLAILAFAQLFAFAVPPPLAMCFMGGFAAGYATYGASHTLIHRKRFRTVLLRRWAGAHHIHHCHPDSNFGVTSSLWDVVLGTRYKRDEGSRE